MGKMVVRVHFALEEAGLGLPLHLVAAAAAAAALLSLFPVVSPFPLACLS
jgi:hypothetical protein